MSMSLVGLNLIQTSSSAMRFTYNIEQEKNIKMAARSVALIDPSPEARDVRKALFHTPKVPDTPITGIQ